LDHGVFDMEIAVQYDPRSIRLHWITAALVVALWCLGETIDWFPKGAARIFARSTHICLGALLGLVLCYRVWWRSRYGLRLPPQGATWMRATTALVHFSLYALLIAVVALGVANAWVRGDNLFNLFSIPAFDPDNKLLRSRVEDLHSLGANILLILVGLHAAAGLLHDWILKDGTLLRMRLRGSRAQATKKSLKLGE